MRRGRQETVMLHTDKGVPSSTLSLQANSTDTCVAFILMYTILPSTTHNTHTYLYTLTYVCMYDVTHVDVHEHTPLTCDVLFPPSCCLPRGEGSLGRTSGEQQPSSAADKRTGSGPAVSPSVTVGVPVQHMQRTHYFTAPDSVLAHAGLQLLSTSHMLYVCMRV